MKPSVLIELDKLRNIRLNTNALVKLEDIIGKPLSEIGSNFGIKEIRSILFVGLLHEDKSLTLDAVGDLIDLVGVEAVAEAVGKAMELAIGKPAKETEKDPN